jgi:hypothetical protein
MIYGSWVAAEPSGFFLSKAWKTINCEDVYEIGTFLFGGNALVVCSILFLIMIPEQMLLKLIMY